VFISIAKGHGGGTQQNSLESPREWRRIKEILISTWCQEQQFRDKLQVPIAAFITEDYGVYR
jgi:hypothetical protein